MRTENNERDKQEAKGHVLGASAVVAVVPAVRGVDGVLWLAGDATMKETESLEYKAAEAVYVLFWQDMMYRHKDRILENITDNPDTPSFEELYSEDYAKGMFHDYAYIEAIIQNVVKGRGFE